MKHLVGQYFLNLDSVKVYVNPYSADGHAQLPGHWQCKGKIHNGFLTIGIQHHYEYSVGVLLHEAMEFVTVRLLLRYHADQGAHQGPDIGLFVLTHDQFSHITDTVGPFLADCLPDFNKAYRRYHK